MAWDLARLLRDFSLATSFVAGIILLGKGEAAGTRSSIRGRRRAEQGSDLRVKQLQAGGSDWVSPSLGDAEHPQETTFTCEPRPSCLALGVGAGAGAVFYRHSDLARRPLPFLSFRVLWFLFSPP